ncbi:hypothetical protein [Actibacterium lipolyticum]|uniref:Glycosyltransferase RgtA/B/C/D-like domain-containing protein n=1 Tax=Actibacterium lipolyticum TaxID=1524263 RepID=A0A238KM78_9RHOB|nr:hypothetical protein [Actibacterium lipolyticum]SMX43767.1 hypothetical protein COL8621_02378 [Actibacterium lipolyticum]
MLTDTVSHRVESRGELNVVWCALFVVAFTALPILAHINLPLVDLPNHIARLYIAAMAPENALSEYYSYEIGLVPNSAVDLIWLGLGAPGDVTRFSNWVMASYAVNLVGSTMALARVIHGRWTRWSAAAGLLVFSAPFFWGFQNYVWSMPFTIYGIALWLGMERPDWRRYRFAVFLIYAAAVYLMHFFAFGFLAVAVFGREVQLALASKGSVARRLIRLGVQMVPFVIPLVWLLVMLKSGPESPAELLNGFGYIADRIAVFTSPAIAPNTQSFPALNLLGAAVLALLAVFVWCLRKTDGPRLVLEDKARGVLIALVLLSLVAPTWLNGVAFVQIRAPVLTCAVFIACTSWRGLSRGQLRGLVAIIAILICARGIAFERFAYRYDAEVRDMRAATGTLSPGDRVLPIRAEVGASDLRLSHLQGLLVPQADVFVPTLFQGVHAITLLPQWADHAHPALFAVDFRLLADDRHPTAPYEFVQNWDKKFTHVLLLDKRQKALPASLGLNQVREVGRFSLYRVEPSFRQSMSGQ